MPDDVEIIAEATADQVSQAIYPVGQVKDEQASEAETKAAEEFLNYLTTDAATMDLFVQAGFKQFTE